MPTIRDLRAAVREPAGAVLFDKMPKQAIHSVVVVPEPEGVPVAFDTVLPCWATVELFRMVTGEVDLDMEKANLEWIEVELFAASCRRPPFLDFELRERVRPGIDAARFTR